jgi:16S rRNA (uracil1498-N3)-methyltransferase
MRMGDRVEAFDDEGATADAEIVAANVSEVTLAIGPVRAARASVGAWSLASAVPKGPRADWLVEKLSELGAAAFIPLITQRSVVAPQGVEKLARWGRLASEAARQSARGGVMRIEPLAPLEEVVARASTDATGWFFSTDPNATPIGQLIQVDPPPALVLFIGPEGGWTEGEINSFNVSNFTAVRLTNSILRVETAALAAAAICATWFDARLANNATTQ